ncbi:MAG: discoidin domain-containing protein [Methylococcaceae bacterium]|nr:discoidin domain-containing protein [Methylococcaceae bacterium]
MKIKMKIILRNLFFLIIYTGASQVAHAECDLWSEPIDHRSIKVHYDITSCKKAIKDKGVKLCLKKANSYLGACIKGSNKYTEDKKGTYTFAGLTEGTKYKIKGLYKENIAWKKVTYWKKFDRTIQTTNKQNVQCNEKTVVLSGKTTKIDTSGIFHANFPSWKAFDNKSSSMWQSKIWEEPAWISYQWNKAQAINQYSITYPSKHSKKRAPKNWEFQGWNGEKWVTVDTRSNQTKWGENETRTYSVSEPGNYVKYRLYFTDDNDYRDGILAISIASLSFKNCA